MKMLREAQNAWGESYQQKANNEAKAMPEVCAQKGKSDGTARPKVIEQQGQWLWNSKA
jgi:hypothetical protein